MWRCILLSTAALAACSPTLNWRDVQPEGSGAHAQFPCKPAHQTRRLVLAGVAVDMVLYVCSAGGSTWGLGFADVGDPALVGPALTELGNASVRNVGGTSSDARPHTVQGMTPNEQAQRLRLAGRMPDGKPAHGEVVLFTKGTRVFQATVIGAQPSAEAVDTFFGALRLSS